jgi:hypothetical protein
MHKENGREIPLRLDTPVAHQAGNPPIVFASDLLRRMLML